MMKQVDWDIRHHLYQVFASKGFPPNAQAIAHHFGVTFNAARESLRRLHDAHALFLRPGSDDILMANPLSAIETNYRVTVGDRLLYANCAWDSLGIPAMLQVDARISARHPLDGEIISYGVQEGQLVNSPLTFVHFAKPFRHWYDDLVDT